MEINRLIDLMGTIEKIKCNTRHSYTSTNRHESVAEHSWRLSMLAYFIKDEFPTADINKVILMCLCHDLGEAFTGDIPAFLKTKSDEMVESQAIEDFLLTLPAPYKEELTHLFLEMEELKTMESKIFKALDKMEAIISHNEADISTWIPIEYEENLTYGTEEVAFSNYMVKLKEYIYNQSIEKINSKTKEGTSF